MHVPLRLKQAMTLGGLGVRELTVRTWEKINENEITTRAAAVAFYAMMALVPFLGVVITVVARLLPDFSRDSRQLGTSDLTTVNEMRVTLSALLPREAYTVIEAQIVRLQQQPPVGLISLGVIVGIWLAASLFVAVIDALNRVYGVVETRSFLRVRLTAICLTVVQAVILVGSLGAILIWPWVLHWLGLSSMAAAMVTAAQWAAVMVMVLFSFALAFYFAPDADQRWEWITPGSIFGTAVFLIVTLAFRLYVQHFANYDRTYGALGGVMVLLFWLWLTSLVLLTAGQINKLIEDASPIGKPIGQKIDLPDPPDLAAIPPECALDPAPSVVRPEPKQDHTPGQRTEAGASG